MIPVGNYIEITPIPEQRNIIMSKSLFQRATVKQVSPDLKASLREGSEIFYAGSRGIQMPGQVFLNADYIVLWK